MEQRADIEKLRDVSRSRARRSRIQGRETRQRIEDLEDEVGELALLCRTLLTVFRESGHIDPSRFEEVMNEIDAADGVIDGKYAPEPEKPEKPEAPVRRKRRR